MGATEAAAWLRAGNPSPLDLIRKDDFDTMERAAAVSLFRSAERRVDYAAFAPEADFDVGPPEPGLAVRRTERGVRRIKLPRA